MTQIKTHSKLLLTGFTQALAANKAILNPLLQLLEAKDVWVKGKGQLTFTAATKAGAQVLRQISHLEVDIQHKFKVHLMPDPQHGAHTIRFCIVGDKIPASSFTAGTLFNHFDSMCEVAIDRGGYMADNGYICTPATELKLYFFTSADTVVESSHVNADTIASIAFAASGHSLANMPEGFVRDKAGSLAGLLPMWKPADQMTATLLLVASSSKNAPLLLAGSPIRYSTGHRSVPGDTMDPKHKGTALSASVAAIFMAEASS